MDLQIKGKRALVTGSSSRIGEAIAKLLAAEGVSIIVHGRRESEVTRVRDEIAKLAGRSPRWAASPRMPGRRRRPRCVGYVRGR